MDTPAPFQPKVDARRPRKVTAEFACAGLFYASVLTHTVICFIIFGAKNTETIVYNPDGGMDNMYTCPKGFAFCLDAGKCTTDTLCEEIKTCQQTYPSSQRRLADVNAPRNVWEFLEEHAYQPTVMFAAVLILSVAWLWLMQHFPRTVVYGSLVMDILLMVAAFIWFYVETKAINYAIIVLVVILVIGMVVLRKQIATSCVMLKVAMDGLFSNKRLFIVTFTVQLAWAAFFTMWIAAIITRQFVMAVRTTPEEETGRVCDLVGSWAVHPALGIWMVVHYYWFTYFMRNINVMTITANVSGWYFKDENYKSNWRYAIKWALFNQAGGNAIASAVMGFLEYLLSRVGSPVSLVLGCLNPFEWIFLCIGLCLKTVAQTYTKFGVIAMTFSGRGFCEAAPKCFKVLKANLGDAVVTDYVGKRVMAWVTYVIALAVGFGMWGWADAVQENDTLGAMGTGLTIVVMFLYAWAVSYPFFGLVIIIIIEQLLSGAAWDEDTVVVRLALNSVFGSLFVACIAFFLLNFLSQVVVTAMDVALFCFAVERTNGQQQVERFDKLYGSIKESFVVGTLPDSAAVGMPVGGAVVVPTTNEQPIVAVVGRPMEDNGQPTVEVTAPSSVV